LARCHALNRSRLDKNDATLNKERFPSLHVRTQTKTSRIHSVSSQVSETSPTATCNPVIRRGNGTISYIRADQESTQKQDVVERRYTPSPIQHPQLSSSYASVFLPTIHSVPPAHLPTLILQSRPWFESQRAMRYSRNNGGPTVSQTTSVEVRHPTHPDSNGYRIGAKPGTLIPQRATPTTCR